MSLDGRPRGRSRSPYGGVRNRLLVLHGFIVSGRLGHGRGADGQRAPVALATLAGGPVAGVRTLPDEPLAMPDPTAPIMILLRRVEWVGLWGSATFYW